MKEQSTEDSGRHRTAWGSFPIGRYVPVDLLLILGFLVLADVVLYTVPRSAVVPRTVVGLPLLFFVPGYILVATLFPGRDRAPGVSKNWQDIAADAPSPADSGIDWPARLALSVGASVALLPLYALGLSVAGLPYSTTVIALGITGFSVAGAAVATVYRNRLPTDEQFGLPVEDIRSLASGVVDQPSALDSGLNLVVAVVVLVSVTGIGLTLAAPHGSSSFTSVSLLTESPDGDLVAAGYPEEIPENGSELVLEVSNSEGEPVNYTVVGEIQRVQTDGTNTTVLERQEVVRLTERVGDGDAWRARHQVEPALPGDDRRLVYYVYRGEAPATPGTESAHRHVNIWVDVEAGQE